MQPTLVSIASRGPLARLLRALGILKDEALLPGRAIALLLVVTWVPLALLSLVRGTFVGGAVEISFLANVAVQAKLLLTLPLLVLAEAGVAKSARLLIATVRERSLLTDDGWAALEGEVQRLRRWRDSIVVEVVIVVLVVFLVILVERSGVMRSELQRSSWLAEAGAQPSPAGWWYLRVSLFALVLLSLRWAWWILLWLRFLVVFLRPRLRVVPAHPDGVGGLAFLSKVQVSLAPVFMAFSVTVSGRLANELLYEGSSLEAVVLPGVVVLVVSALAMFGPMLLFSLRMYVEQSRVLSAYDRVGQGLVDDFDARWVHEDVKPGAMLDAPHAASVTAFTSVYRAIGKMKLVPIYLPYLIGSMVLVAVPFFPLVLTEFSLADLARRMTKLLL